MELAYWSSGPCSSRSGGRRRRSSIPVGALGASVVGFVAAATSGGRDHPPPGVSSSQVSSEHTPALPVLPDIAVWRRELRLGKRPVQELPDAAVVGNSFFCLSSSFSCLCNFRILGLVILVSENISAMLDM
jgi:hypothetical protein